MFNTVISIFVTANSLENVYPAIILCKVRHRDWASAENEKMVLYFFLFLNFFFLNLNRSVLLLFNASFWPVFTPCTV